MKLVAQVGPGGRLAAPAAQEKPKPAAARPLGRSAQLAQQRAARAEAVQAGVARALAQARSSPAAPPPAATPAQEAAVGQELLAAARALLDELGRLAA